MTDTTFAVLSLSAALVSSVSEGSPPAGAVQLSHQLRGGCPPHLPDVATTGSFQVMDVWGLVGASRPIPMPIYLDTLNLYKPRVIT